MSGEDAMDYGAVTGDFRIRCPECGLQVQFAGGQRVEPDCGHELPGLVVEL